MAAGGVAERWFEINIWLSQRFCFHFDVVFSSVLSGTHTHTQAYTHTHTHLAYEIHKWPLIHLHTNSTTVARYQTTNIWRLWWVSLSLSLSISFSDNLIIRWTALTICNLFSFYFMQSFPKKLFGLWNAEEET